jgi:hypothetical protein
VPFRSETEPLREQIRRAEEQASELIEERAALEAQLAAHRAASGVRRKQVALAGVLAVMATSFLGFALGDLAADKAATQARFRREQRQMEESGGAVTATRECAQSRAATESAIGFCDRQRDTARRQLQWTPPSTAGRRDPLPAETGGLR